MKKRLFSFLLALILFCNCPMTVNASSGISFVTDMANQVLLNNADIGNRLRLYCEQIGLWLNPSKWGDGSLFDLFGEYMKEKALILSVDDYEEYLQAHMTITEDENGNYEYHADSDMMNTLYDFSQDLISDCGWYEYVTTDYRKISATMFYTKDLYESFISYCNENLKGTDNIVVYYNKGSVYEYVGVSEPFSLLDIEFYKCNNSSYGGTISGCTAYITQNWSTVEKGIYKLSSSGMGVSWNTTNTVSLYESQIFTLSSTHQPITDGSRIVRVYKTLSDLKQYTVGQRPYYMTTEYNNYDSRIDNSTTITQTTIDNSVAYGDVYNYITNNYENSDGLTEDQLRDILDDYLDELKNQNSNSGNDSGNGSGSDSDSSGGGLGSFLSGLGSVGDAILSILGKLLEYVGKAIDLLTNTATKVIDLVPQNVTNLNGALFSFFPQDWLTAIELSLVLAVIIGIVGIFKK